MPMKWQSPASDLERPKDRGATMRMPCGDLACSWPWGYSFRVVSVRRTEEFVRWLRGLRRLRAKAFIQARIQRVICGNPGYVRPVGAGVSELRIHYSPGYRVCFQQRDSMLVNLLAGADKSAHAKDLKSHQDLARNFKEDE